MSEEHGKRIGVFVCHCGYNIAGVVDVAAVVEEISKLPDVYCVDHTYLCSEPGLNLIKEKVREEGLSRVVVAACTPKLHEKLFQETIEEAGLNRYLLSQANIREQCSWVHKANPRKATLKAIDLIKMAVAKARLLREQPRIEVPVERDVLVIGGGIAGITAALNLADLGHRVYLVEREPSIGGHMAMLDKVFPTRDCSICILAPLMVEVSRHPNIQLITYAEVTKVSGWIGNFEVEITKYPRFVKESECTGCGICAEYCPVEVPNEFDQNLGTRKAVYIPFPQAVPLIYTIDPEHCIGCRTCEAVCDREAIDLSQREEKINVRVGAILIATGYDTFDPSEKRNLGYGLFQNVVTALELERLLSPSGPSMGEVVRPSDGKTPKRIVFIQCVGSRDESVGRTYCSRVCCTYAVKQALELRDRIPDAEIYVFYQDMRTFGKGFEESYREAIRSRVRFIRGLVSKVVEDPKTKNLVVMAEDTLLGTPVEIEADLVVLSVGMVPSKGTERLLFVLNVPTSEDGFVMEAHPKLRPVETQVPGIYVAGCAQGPKDIQDTVAQASAAASKISSLLSKGKVELEPYVPVIDNEICIRCGLCVAACDRGVIKMSKEGVTVTGVGCLGCGACAGACPTGALQMSLLSDEMIRAQIDAVLEEKREYPLIIGFLCNWCAYNAADMAGVAKIQYPTNLRAIWVPCTGRVNPVLILDALEKGADGVMVLGCYPHDCHYLTGFEKAKRRVESLREVLRAAGIDPRRVRIESMSASEGKKLAEVVKEFVDELMKLPVLGEELVKAAEVKGGESGG
ncbi:MAG: CoB-CoM heterodisulfide reductase HdrA2 [Candidatus Freyarchaeota archaeon]|nr:CoB-CoM heterodisulfide reductase HdrA2 [Candidatus Freyrarchaeum guaymaensis]